MTQWPLLGNTFFLCYILPHLLLCYGTISILYSVQEASSPPFILQGKLIRSPSFGMSLTHLKRFFIYLYSFEGQGCCVMVYGLSIYKNHKGIFFIERIINKLYSLRHSYCLSSWQQQLQHMTYKVENPDKVIKTY